MHLIVKKTIVTCSCDFLDAVAWAWFAPTAARALLLSTQIFRLGLALGLSEGGRLARFAVRLAIELAAFVGQLVTEGVDIHCDPPELVVVVDVGVGSTGTATVTVTGGTGGGSLIKACRRKSNF